MKKYIIYDATGEIVAFGTCDDASIPSDQGLGTLLENVDATPDTHHVVNGELVPWTEDEVTARQLPKAKLDQWEIVKAARDASVYSTFTWNGMVFDADDVSQQRIQGAVQLASLATAASQSFSIGWTLHDNTTATLSGADMVNVGLALGKFVQDNFAQGVLLRSEISAATTIADVEAVVWA